MDETRARARVGESIDRYVLEDLLGAGGFGAVYRARHTHMGRQVALKVLHPNPPPSPEMQERFLREARAAAAIDEPGIVHVYDCGVTAEGEAFLAMELLDGEDLADHLSRHGVLPMERAVELALGILRPLGAAHAAGVVHRDLKPANVFLARGAVKLLDFGISKLEGEGVAPLTKTGVVMGTPHYMAPETFRGAASVDHRADLYAVGAMLFEMIAGRPPHDAETYERLVVKVATEPAPPLASVVPTVPEALARVVDAALATDPGRRPASAAELASALAPFESMAAKMGSAQTAAVPSMVPATRGTPPSEPAASSGWGQPASPSPAPPSAVSPSQGSTPHPVPAAPTPLAHPPSSSGLGPKLAIGLVVALALGGLMAWAVPAMLDALDTSGAERVATDSARPPEVTMPTSEPKPTVAPVAPSPPVSPSPPVPPPTPSPMAVGSPGPPTPVVPPASSGPIQIAEPRIVGGLSASAVLAAARGRRSALQRCRTGSSSTVRVQLLVSAGGRIAIAQPDPTTDPGPIGPARCVANVFRDMGRIPQGGQGIAFLTVDLAGR